MIAIALVVILVAVMVAACSSKNESGSASSDSGAKASSSPSASASGAEASGDAQQDVKALDPVELVWYYPQWSAQQDLQQVQDAMNKIVKDKINATVTLKSIDFGDYEQKMNIAIAANEAFDIVWTANWAFNYQANALKGAFLPLNELLENYGKDVYDSMPSYIWNATNVGGKIYGVPNYQTVTNRPGFLVQKQYAEKYKLDPSQIKKFSDLEPFLEAVKAGEPNLVPLAMDRTGSFRAALSLYNLEEINYTASFYTNTDSIKVINMFETPEFKEYLTLVRSWYKKGLINQDAPTLKSFNDLTSTGQAVARFHNVLKPGGEAEYKGQFGGNEIIYVPVGNSTVGTNTIITTMNAVSKTSKNPERAMMFLNLINTDKELYNLMSYGIEGEHYTKISDDTIRLIEGSGYATGSNWMYGNTFNGYYMEGQAPGTWEATIEDNNNAIPSKLMGFTFNNEPVKAEIANLATIMDEYEGIISTGASDFEKKLPELNDRLKKAGSEAVEAEAQRQIDEWLKTSGK